MITQLLASVYHALPAPLKRVALGMAPEALVMAQIRQLWARPEIEHWPPEAQADEPGLARYEYGVFSQNGEDGILRHVFDEIGFGSRRFVEFGFGVHEFNALRLVLNEQFGGVLLDGSEKSVSRFNRMAAEVGVADAVQAVCCFLSLDNLEQTITAAGVSGEVDLLAIDVDGNDYWFWEASNFLNPRVVVIEYNASFGADAAVTIPYDPAFERHAAHPSGTYCRVVSTRSSCAMTA
jgi:hypothetical protein